MIPMNDEALLDNPECLKQLEEYTQDIMDMISFGIEKSNKYIKPRTTQELIELLSERYPYHDFSTQESTVEALKDELSEILHALCHQEYNIYNIALINQLKQYQDETQKEESETKL